MSLLRVLSILATVFASYLVSEVTHSPVLAPPDPSNTWVAKESSDFQRVLLIAERIQDNVMYLRPTLRVLERGHREGMLERFAICYIDEPANPDALPIVWNVYGQFKLDITKTFSLEDYIIDNDINTILVLNHDPSVYAYVIATLSHSVVANVYVFIGPPRVTRYLGVASVPLIKLALILKRVVGALNNVAAYLSDVTGYQLTYRNQLISTSTKAPPLSLFVFVSDITSWWNVVKSAWHNRRITIDMLFSRYMNSSKCFGTHGRVSVVDDRIFVTVGEHPPHTFPYVPSKELLTPDNAKSLFPFRNPLWMYEDNPYMAFLPARDPLISDWLQTLNHTFRTLPVCTDTDGKFALQPSTAEEWESLEVNLRLLYNRLLQLAHAPLSHSFRLWPWPRQLGYTRKHKSEYIARRQILASRNAFLALLGTINFFARHLQYEKDVIVKLRSSDSEFAVEDLLQLLQTDLDISPVWMHDWRATAYDTPYVGAFIDVKDTGCLSHVKIMRRFSIPTCLCWGTVGHIERAPQIIRDDAPAQADIDDAIRGQATFTYPRRTDNPATIGIQTSTSWEGNPAIEKRTSTHLADSLLSMPSPAVFQGTSQKQGEDHHQFFQRRNSARQEYLSRETEQKRQARLQREAHAQKDLPPGRRGSVVFYWAYDSGFRIRTFAGRSNYDYYWSRYSRTQRRYDSVYDEWDVCTDFGEDNESDDDFENEEESFAPIQVDEPVAVEELPKSTDSMAYLRMVYTKSLEREFISSHETPSIEDIASFRLGMVGNPVDSIRFDGSNNFSSLLGNEPISWDQAQFLAGSHGGSPSPTFRESFCAFMTVFAKLGASDLMAFHWADTLDLIATNDYVVRKRWPFNVSLIQTHDTRYYVLHWRDGDDQDIHLALPSGANVLEIVRRGWPGPAKELIPWLIHRGFTFRTFTKLSSTTRLHATPKFRSPARLGFRPRDYEFNLLDYASYVHQRNLFLQTPRGRAAVLLGGIVGRIASDIVSIDDIVEGPRQMMDLRGFGECITFQSEHYWDDQLTEEELDLICGLYDVEVERKKDGTFQLCKKSWWPKPTSWKNTGFSLGHWSPDAEAWYKERLKAIKSGAAKLYTNREWKNAIKGSKRALAVAGKQEKLADDYIRLFHKL
ncbi:hypothetical protein VNI00_013505 [Paramarasmius palmivorus]|uniref:Uncharacterized protein n=1 Tax=Paramarasmius palmivorus TaxID=297713 RepID=A0AAW0BW97_9AGAR